MPLAAAPAPRVGRRPLLLLLAALLCACGPSGEPPAPTATFDSGISRLARATPRPLIPVPTVTPGGESVAHFARDIQPILREHCQSCHGGLAGLWLTEYEYVLLGGDVGPIVVPGEPASSRLYRYVDEGLMPLDAPRLADDELELIRRWIEEGAHKN